MSFWNFGKAFSSIGKNLEKTFEKNADKAANDPDDGSQAQSDARKAGEDTGSTARDAASDEIENHDPAWKGVKDLSDQALDTIPKVEAAAKVGWLKFVGVVTAIFAVAATYSFMQSRPPEESPKAMDPIQFSRIESEQIQALSQLTISEDDFNMMTGGLLVQSAPAPIENPARAAATPAPLPPPPAVAAIAEEPAEVEITTSSGTQEVTTTVGQVYENAPQPVRHTMESPPPSPVTHGYDGTEDTSHDCSHTHCLSPSPHRGFTVTAVDGNGNTFGTAQVTY